MRYSIIIFLAISLVTGCIGTDVIDDQIVNLSISIEETSLVNNSAAALIGSQHVFKASASNDRGSIFEPPVTWNSSNNAVAVIDSSGNLEALSIGTTFITATGLGIQSNRIKITVVKNINDIALIEVTGNKSMLALDESIDLAARALNANGEEVAGVTITWESSDNSIATVTSSGTATGHSAGNADIIASAENVSSNYGLTVGQSLERSGQFEPLNGYQTRGSVTLSLGLDEAVNINLGDDFEASNGPGLYVYLSNNRASISGGVEVGKLRSNSGADTYVVPSNVTLNEYDYVLIYCKPFGVGFGTAQLDGGS